MKKTAIESIIEPLNMGLKPRGRKIRVDTIKESELALELSGFCCSGGCDCIDAFKHRVTELVQMEYPQLKTITFTFE